MNFIERGQKIGELVEAKSKQYAGTTEAAAGMMLCLFPEGIPTEKMGSALLLVRICDKMGRIAQGDGTGDEDAWGDIAGYGLIGQKHNEDEMNENATEVNWCVSFPPGSIGKFMRNLEKGIEEVTERMKTFNASRQQGKSAAVGAVLGACCGNCNNYMLCREKEESGNEAFPNCKGVTDVETGKSIPLGSPLPNWEPTEGALPEVTPEPASGNIKVISTVGPEEIQKFFSENGKPAGLTWGMLSKVKVREDGTLFLSPDEKPVDVSGLKKEPVVVHGCDDCKYGELTSEDEPCKDCGGWDAATGDTLPGWEPENG